MEWRYRKVVRLAPGLRMNISKSGISFSIGRPGATLNVGPRGKRVTLGLPGTGLSTTHRLPFASAEPARARPRFGIMAVVLLVLVVGGVAYAL